MNDLKLRVWLYSDKKYIKWEDLYMSKDRDRSEFYIWDNEPVIMSPLPKSSYKLEQFTGIQDNNGVDLYVGDIVAISDDYDTYKFAAGIVREVYFKDCCYRLKPLINLHLQRGYLIADMDDFEIIGNIHEDKELLK